MLRYGAGWLGVIVLVVGLGLSRPLHAGDNPPPVAAPTFTPNSGTFSAEAALIISSATNGAELRYTLDGREPSPTVGTPLANGGKVMLAGSATVKAVAYMEGRPASAIATAAFTKRDTVAAPAFTPNGGVLVDAPEVRLSCVTPGVSIRYTTDGTAPTPAHGHLAIEGEPIRLTAAATSRIVATLRAVAYKAGMDASPVAAADFTLPSVAEVTPPTPGNFRIHSPYTYVNRVYMVWDSIPGHPTLATKYEIFLNGEKIDETGASYLEYLDLLPLKTYRYKVRAKWGNAYVSEPTAELEVTPPGPVTPHNFRIHSPYTYANRAYMVWDSISSHPPLDTKYEIFLNGEKIDETGASYLEYHNLLPLKTYRYKVRGIWGGEYPSGMTEELEVTPPGPDAPTNLLYHGAYTYANRIYMQWSGISGHPPLETKYEIYRNGEKIDETTRTDLEYSDLLPLKTYRYKVRANWGGEYPSDMSNEIEVTPPGPAAPTNLLYHGAYTYANRIYMQWSGISGHPPFETRYEIYRNGEKIDETTRTDLEYSDLLPLKTYRYQVRANWGGEYPSDMSNEIEVTPPGPQTPSNLHLWSLRGGRVEFAWNTISGHPPFETVYEVFRDGEKVGETTSYYFSQEGLLPGATHAYTVRARWGDDVVSEMSSELTVAVMPRVTQIYLYHSTPTRAYFEWYSDDAGRFGDYRYELFRDDEAEPIHTGTGSWFQDTRRTPGATHQYRIRLVLPDHDYVGELSEPLTVNYRLPTSPDIHAGQVRGNGVDLYWYDYDSGEVDYVPVYQIHRDGVMVGRTENGSWADNDLAPGSTVTYTLRVEYGGDEPSAPCRPITVATRLPEIPDWHASRVTGNSITLSWPAMSATGYTPEYDIEADGVKVATTRESQWTDAGLMPGDTRTYRIRSRFFDGCESEWGEARPVTTLLPVPPTVTVNQTFAVSVRLSIQYPTSDTGYDHEFEIERDGAVIGTIHAAGHWDDGGLRPGTTYVYRLRTRFYHGCESEWSEPLSATTRSPEPPIVWTGTVSANSVTLNWRDPVQTNYDTEYDIMRDAAVVATLRGKSWTDTGLAPGATHVYRLRSRFFAGSESAWSEPLPVTTVGASAPSYFHANSEASTEIHLYWDDTARRNSGYDAEYDIERDGSIVATIRNSWWNDTGLAPESTHEYRIRTRLYPGCESPWSPTVSATTQPLYPPYIYIGEAGGNFLTLYIETHYYTGGGERTYEIRRDGEVVATTQDYRWTDTGLTPGTEYRYEVRLWMAGVASDWSDPQTGRTRLPEPPNAWVNDYGAQSVTLRWNDRFTTGYECEYDIRKNGEIVATLKNREWTDSGLMPGVSNEYQFRTRFYDGCESDWGSTLTGRTVGPETPSEIYLQANGGTSITMHWRGTDTSDYNVEYDIERDGVVIATRGGMGSWGSYQDTGLESDTEYTYRIRARFFEGCESGWSTPRSCRTMAVPKPYLYADNPTGRSIYLWASFGNYEYYSSARFALECNGEIVETKDGWEYTTFNRNDLTPGQTYIYRVRTITDEWGESPWSDPVAVTARLPEAPGLNIGAVTGNSVYLHWGDPFNSGYDTREFDLLRNGVVVHTTRDTGWTNADLTPGTTYVYRIRTRFYPGMESGWGEEKSVTTRLPEAPRDFTVRRIGWDRVELGWRRMDNPGYAATYEIWRDGEKIGSVVDGDAYDDSGLTAGAKHIYTLRTTFFEGCSSAFSGETSVTIPTPAGGTGLRGRYYTDTEFKKLSIERLDAGVNFPDFHGSSPADDFSARWEGSVQVPLNDDYFFRIRTSGGVRLWVNGKLAIDAWNHAGGVNSTSEWMGMASGRRYSLRLDWRGGQPDRNMALQWEGRRFIGENIPASQCFPAVMLGVDGFGATTPGESVASPAWLEGEAASDTAAVRFRVNDGMFADATIPAPGKWYADNASQTPGLPRGVLLSMDVPAEVRLEAVDPEGYIKESQYTLTWKTTRLDGLSAERDEIHIRQGDSLLFAVGEDGTSESAATIQTVVSGNIAAAPGARHAVRYNATGEYTVRGLLDGEEAGSVKVLVVGLPATGNIIPFNLNDRRSREIRVRPLTAVPALTAAVDDPSLVKLTNLESTGNGMRVSFSAAGDAVGSTRVAFRLNGPDGPMLGDRQLHVVSIWLVSGASLPELHRYPDGSRLTGATVGMYPRIPDVPMRISGLSGEMLFDGIGGSEHVVYGRSFDVNGQFNYCILSNGGTCHNIGVAELAD